MGSRCAPARGKMWQSWFLLCYSLRSFSGCLPVPLHSPGEHFWLRDPASFRNPNPVTITILPHEATPAIPKEGILSLAWQVPTCWVTCSLPPATSGCQLSLRLFIDGSTKPCSVRHLMSLIRGSSELSAYGLGSARCSYHRKAQLRKNYPLFS